MNREIAPSPARFVRALIRAERPAYALTAAAWIVWHSLPLMAGVLAKWFFDALLGRAPIGLGPYAIVALVVATGAARAAAMLVAARAGTPMRFRMRSLLQLNILRQVLQLPGARALEGSVGDAVSTLRDDAEQAALAADWPYDALAGSVFAGGGIAILLLVNARLTALVVLPIAVLLALANAVRARLVRARAQSRQATADVTGGVGEIFHAVQAVQAASAEERVLAHLGRLGERRARTAVRDVMLDAGFDAAFSYAMRAGAGIVLLLAAADLRSGTFSVGDFALFATYLMQVADYMGFVAYLISSYQQSAVSFGRMLRMMRGVRPATLVRGWEEGPTREETPARHAATPFETLTVREISVTHDGGRGLSGVSFTMERGSMTAVAGGTGAGKTSLVRALLGLVAAGGEILWNGLPVSSPREFMVAPRVAYVPQVPALLSGTVRENVAMGRPLADGELRRAAADAMLSGDLEGMPAGWDTPVGPGGVRLSGGQAQRVAIARALVGRPDLLILDDVTSALDAATEYQLWRRLAVTGRTCLIVTNRRQLLREVNEVVWLEDGRLCGIGTYPELARQGLQAR